MSVKVSVLVRFNCVLSKSAPESGSDSGLATIQQLTAQAIDTSSGPASGIGRMPRNAEISPSLATATNDREDSVASGCSRRSWFRSFANAGLAVSARDRNVRRNIAAIWPRSSEVAARML